MIPEKLIQEYLNLQTRKDVNTSNDRAISLNLKSDLAYIRTAFKRYIYNNKISQIRLVNNKFEGIVIDLNCSFKDKKLNYIKLLNSIQAWINYEEKCGNTPYKLEVH